jgi:hypothetical protein
MQDWIDVDCRPQPPRFDSARSLARQRSAPSARTLRPKYRLSTECAKQTRASTIDTDQNVPAPPSSRSAECGQSRANPQAQRPKMSLGADFRGGRLRSSTERVAATHAASPHVGSVDALPLVYSTGDSSMNAADLTLSPSPAGSLWLP